MGKNLLSGRDVVALHGELSLVKAAVDAPRGQPPHPRPRPNAIEADQIRGWKTILNTLSIHYGDRIAAVGH